MDNNLWEQIMTNLNAAITELRSQIKVANKPQTNEQTKLVKHSIIEENHKNIRAASNKEILRKQLELLAEYSRLPEGHAHMAECSFVMVLIYRELVKFEN